MNYTLLASSCACIGVILATLIIADIIMTISARSKEKYLKETQVEMDDVLLTIPPEKLLDVTLACSAFAGFTGVGVIGFYTQSLSVSRMLLTGILCAAAVFPLPRLYLRYLKKQRMKKFNEQLEDALLSMSSSLKAGFSINQALEVIARENRKPISFEFNLLLQEMRLGVTMEEALDKMSKRLDCPDFELVAVSILTARQTGGELTQTLERLAAVIRERIRITGRIRALTAQGRMQAVIIGLMPVALFFAMMNIAPDMMNSFFTTVPGVLCLLAVIALDFTGFILIRKITNIDI